MDMFGIISSFQGPDWKALEVREKRPVTILDIDYSANNFSKKSENSG